jgi:hypothetical protein
MVTTMTHLEARERVIARIVQRREELLKAPSVPRERTSPAAHYHISKYPKASYDMTGWLGDLAEDPAVKVSSSFKYFLIYSYGVIGLHSKIEKPSIGKITWSRVLWRRVCIL